MHTVAVSNPIATLVVGGIAVGMLYGILVLGVVLVYQVSAAVNFTYGQYGAIGSLVAFSLASSVHAPLLVALAIGLLVGAALSGLTQVFIFDRLGPVGTSGRDLLVGLGLLLSLIAISETVTNDASNRISGLGARALKVAEGHVVAPCVPVSFRSAYAKSLKGFPSFL